MFRAVPAGPVIFMTNSSADTAGPVSLGTSRVAVTLRVAERAAPSRNDRPADAGAHCPPHPHAGQRRVDGVTQRSIRRRVKCIAAWASASLPWACRPLHACAVATAACNALRRGYVLTACTISLRAMNRGSSPPRSCGLDSVGRRRRRNHGSTYERAGDVVVLVAVPVVAHGCLVHGLHDARFTRRVPTAFGLGRASKAVSARRASPAAAPGGPRRRRSPPPCLPDPVVAARRTSASDVVVGQRCSRNTSTAAAARPPRTTDSPWSPRRQHGAVLHRSNNASCGSLRTGTRR